MTLQGAQQVFAILRGRKLIENRAWNIPVGWYALHVGAQHINQERAERIRVTWPDAPPEESLPHSAIVGLFFVQSHRKPAECRAGYVWARGPICHVISKAIEFRTPLRCGGNKGLWALKESQRLQIQRELLEAEVRHFDLFEVIG